MTPEEQQRAEHPARRLMSFAENGIPNAVYDICCELEALSVAALAVRTFWVTELVGPNIPTEDRLRLLHTITSSVRLGTIASSTMAALEPLVRGPAVDEMQRALAWLAGPNSPSGPAGIERFCREIAVQTPKGGADATRDFLQRMYDQSPDEPEGEADG